MVWRVIRLVAVVALTYFTGTRAVNLVRYTSNQIQRVGGGIDIHLQWYDGVLLRQGINPWTAYVEGRVPATPVDFVDGGAIEQPPVAVPGWSTATPQTPPLILLMAPLGMFSLRNASVLWAVLNLVWVGAAVLAWLAYARRCGHRLNPWSMVPVALALPACLGAYVTVANGQVSLFLLALAGAAVLIAARHPILSGALLGITLSKYTVGLPLALFFAIERRFRALAAAAIVQLAGFAIAGAVTATSPLAIAAALPLNAGFNANAPGLHFAALLAGIQPWLIVAVLVAWSAVIFAVVARAVWSSPGRVPAQALGLGLSATLLLWSLPVVYHRMYDAVLLFPALVFVGAQAEGRSARSDALWLCALAPAIIALGVDWSVRFGPAVATPWPSPGVGPNEWAAAAATVWLMPLCLVALARAAGRRASPRPDTPALSPTAP